MRNSANPMTRKRLNIFPTCLIIFFPSFFGLWVSWSRGHLPPMLESKAYSAHRVKSKKSRLPAAPEGPGLAGDDPTHDLFVTNHSLSIRPEPFLLRHTPPRLLYRIPCCSQA